MIFILLLTAVYLADLLYLLWRTPEIKLRPQLDAMISHIADLPVLGWQQWVAMSFFNGPPPLAATRAGNQGRPLATWLRVLQRLALAAAAAALLHLCGADLVFSWESGFSRPSGYLYQLLWPD